MSTGLSKLKTLKTFRYSSALALAITAGLAQFTISNVGHTHGDVQPQVVDTEGLEPTGEEYLEQNPYRLAGDEQYELAIEIGASGSTKTAPDAMALKEFPAV